MKPDGPAAGPGRPAKRGVVPLHPRNRHQGRYDFARLTGSSPQLARFLKAAASGDPTIDFADPDAVRALNRALLHADYGIGHWDLPPGYLCPPVPGRADYVHGLADLLAQDAAGQVPRGGGVRVLDIGVGANCIYPLVGHREYGWQFVGTDVDPVALRVAAANVAANGLADAIELRAQPDRGAIFAGVLHAGDRFDLSLCNPPFHASARDAARGSRRKLRNLGAPGPAAAPPALNFGGQPGELWCTGGEASFLRRMIRESGRFSSQVLWFSSLVSRSETLPELRRQLQKAGVEDVREVPMAQGHKHSRFVAWTFLEARVRQAWASGRPDGSD
ncbi:MAG: 23S rRNA (adenine(1618)-N(6))-methyltransferase RlmF [Pseudomonadota bacterium]|nr:23S rRNA (adenine(1618)-N(6))-methyltransferase RlmF [Pseudomonadota bacterium]